MKLIYITGIDGCGKTTQSKLLLAYLNDIGFSAQYQWLRWSPSLIKAVAVLKKTISRKEISNEKFKATNDKDLQLKENDSFNQWSNLKRHLFSLRMFRYLWLKYASWDYYYSYKSAVSSWYADILILDRYYFDFVVDQSINYDQGIDDFEKKLKDGILNNIQKPDVFILIDIDPQTGWDRKRDGTSIVQLQKLHEVYRSVLDREDVHVVDGSKTVQNIQEEILSIVKQSIGGGDGV